ncbi:ABC-three component system middle component 7 [Clostridium sp. YIM B02551]|uniref:ABC-three component system middle component 7 n=1 Tax=Clostridium sp. YIM B02551 TaxID=2910679 RepID=UPI001EEB78C1|nr:ABC-three component system middle component 7 [Clostridium sp. YIM B02551]
MKLPNKLFSYRESIVSKLPIILNAFEQEKYLTIDQLYINVINKFENISEFLEAVECLYALGKIEYSYELRRVYHAT